MIRSRIMHLISKRERKRKSGASTLMRMAGIATTSCSAHEDAIYS